MGMVGSRNSRATTAAPTPADSVARPRRRVSTPAGFEGAPLARGGLVRLGMLVPDDDLG